MKVIDNNGRLFGKISVIDVLAILVVLALGAALYVKSNQPHTGVSVPTQTITYQVRVDGAPEYLQNSIHVGDAVYDLSYESGGAPLGEIIDIQVLPGTRMAEFIDGTAGPAPVEGGANLLLTIEGEGLVNEEGWFLNRVYSLGVNAARTYYSKYAEFTTTVTAIL